MTSSGAYRDSHIEQVRGKRSKMREKQAFFFFHPDWALDEFHSVEA